VVPADLVLTGISAAVGTGGPLIVGLWRLARFEGRVTAQLESIRETARTSAERLERLENKHMGPHGAAGE
jgi:hypothetical protein